ncbi:MAG: phytanoyl-CoA dioxygenase family protein [Gammaproteobacteria bacterium]|nr:phytanoyl-CoA dioxygenase family protein [Gammaproteobacteria bacterium]
MLTPEQIDTFFSQGYLVLPNFCSEQQWQGIRDFAEQQLQSRAVPVELESDLEYPGAPTKENDAAETIRRLKQVVDRSPIIRDWATSNQVASVLKSLLPSPLYLVRAHHNCIMTKQPEFSSDSWWHQDLRYWRYSEGNLVSTWLALGEENERNGGLMVIPGSHKWSYQPHQFDSNLFFRQDLPENQALLEQKVKLTLNPGDLLLFHCRTLHAATRNYTDQTKMAAVFTYRTESDTPIEGSRSAESEDLKLS